MKAIKLLAFPSSFVLLPFAAGWALLTGERAAFPIVDSASRLRLSVVGSAALAGGIVRVIVVRLRPLHTGQTLRAFTFLFGTGKTFALRRGSRFMPIRVSKGETCNPGGDGKSRKQCEELQSSQHIVILQ